MCSKQKNYLYSTKWRVGFLNSWCLSYLGFQYHDCTK